MKNERIKILMVLASTGMGGAETFALNVLRNIDQSKFKIEFAVNSYSKDDVIYKECVKYDCTFHVLPYFKVVNYFSYVKTWEDFFDAHKFDIVYGHATNSASIYLGIAKKHGMKTISHCHSAGFRGNFLQKLAKRFFIRNICQVADYKFACSDKAGEHLYGHNYRTEKNYYVIPNAIDSNKYLFDEEIRNKIRHSLNIDADSFVCGHIGSFTPVKNHKFLMDVFKSVLEKKRNAKLVCCGDGPLLEDIKTYAKHLGIIDNVVFTGIISNPNEYLMAMDCFIFPSFFEGFPISVLEVQATGLPVVLHDVITTEVDMTSLVHRARLSQSPREWAEIVVKTDPGNRLEYNPIIGSSKYNIQKTVKEFENLYTRLVYNEI